MNEYKTETKNKKENHKIIKLNINMKINIYILIWTHKHMLFLIHIEAYENMKIPMSIFENFELFITLSPSFSNKSIFDI